MKVLFAVLSPIWLAIPWAIHQIVEYQGKMIGGAKYFAHVGIAPGIAVEYMLALTAVVVSVLLLLAAFTSWPLRSVLRGIALVFSLATLYTYLPLVAPALGSFAYVPLAVFPAEFKSFPILAAVLGFVTATVVSSRRAP